MSRKLFECNTEDLYHSYLSCRKRKRSTEQEQSFSINVTANLLNLRNDIVLGKYTPLPSRAFLIDKPVLREIFAPWFRDRVFHVNIAQKIEPLLEKELIYDCYSCRKGKGTLFGIKRLKRFIAQCSANYTKECYVLLCDIKGFFMSISRTRLWKRLQDFLQQKTDNNELLIWQIHKFLYQSPLDHVIIRGNRKKWKALPDSKCLFSCSGAPKPDKFYGEYTAEMDTNLTGVTIGAQPAQMIANFYLSPFDHYCKSFARFYGRYVDDCFIVHNDKGFLLGLIPLLRKFLKSLGLTLHPNKIRILHYKQGIPYLGAMIKGKTILPGRRIKGGMRNLFREIEQLPEDVKYKPEIENYVCRVNSYLGMMKHYNSIRFIREIMDKYPKIHHFFTIKWKYNRAEKIISWRKILQIQHLVAWSKAMKAYHEQFRIRNKNKPFKSKETLYNLCYYGLYGILPLSRTEEYFTIGKI